MLEDRSALLRSSEFEHVSAKKTSTAKVAESLVFCSLAQEILPQPQALLLDSSSPAAGAETHSRVGKRGVAPLLKALGGPIPKGAVFVSGVSDCTVLHAFAMEHSNYGVLRAGRNARAAWPN